MAETAEAGPEGLAPPLSCFLRANLEHGHDRIKTSAHKQDGELADPLKVFLVCHEKDER
jgi:hypothetical protein